MNSKATELQMREIDDDNILHTPPKGEYSVELQGFNRTFTVQQRISCIFLVPLGWCRHDP